MANGFPRFVTSNPALTAFDRQTDLNEERRKREQAAALDDAIRRGMQEQLQPAPAAPPPEQPQFAGPVSAPLPMATTPQPVAAPPQQTAPASGASSSVQAPASASSISPVLRNVLAVPGGGAAALELRQQEMQRQDAERKRQDEQERIAIEALGKGDMTTFRFWQQRTGLQVPEGIVQDAQARSTFSRGMLVAEKLYKDDPAQAQRFVAAYIQSGGDPSRAFQVAGTPRSKPTITLKEVVNENNRVLARVDQQGNFLGFVNGPDGQPLVANVGVADSQNDPADVRSAQALALARARAEGRQPNDRDFVEAFEFVKQAKQNPQTAFIQLFRIFSDMEKAGLPLTATPEQVEQATQRASERARQALIELQGGVMPTMPPPAAGAAGQAAPGQQAAAPQATHRFDPSTGQIVPVQ